MMRPLIALVCAFFAFAPGAAGAKTSMIDYWPWKGVLAQKMHVVLGPGRGTKYVAMVWHEPLGTERGSAPRFQPEFVLYRADGFGKGLAPVYRSPIRGDSLQLVPEMQPIPNTPGVWMPGYVDVRIVGSAQLMGPGENQLVVRIYSSAADCGAATVHVLAVGPGDRLHDVVRAENYCSLEAALQPPGIALKGPYYDPNAPLCCPTKNKATALLRYDRKSGKWLIAPQYFRLSSSLAP